MLAHIHAYTKEENERERGRRMHEKYREKKIT
jgi:hypothetical protein